MTSAFVVAAVLSAAAAPAAATESPRAAGLAAFRAGRWEEASAAFRQELLRAPDAHVVEFNLAGAEFKLEHWDEAECWYRRAAQDPKLAALATLNAGLAAEAAGNLDTALELYRGAAAIGEGTPVAEKAKESIIEVEKEQRSQRRETALRLGREGRAALKSGDAAGAVSLLYGALDEARAAELPDEDRVELEYALGHACLGAGRAADAAAAFGRAAALRPDDAEVQYMLGVALGDGERSRAAEAFRRALAAGLDEDDAARARERLAALTAPPEKAAKTSSQKTLENNATTISRPAPRRPPARVTVEPSLAFGYDTNYLGGREVLFMRGVRYSTTDGAPFLSAAIEPRVRIAGRPSHGLYLGARADALLYLDKEADPFSLMGITLFADGALSPARWITLAFTAQGYLDTAGIDTFGLYQTGAQLAAKATFWEGDHFATRARYGHTFIEALDPRFAYMSGNRDEVSLQELLFSGTWRVALGYTYRREAVGREVAAARDILAPLVDLGLRCVVKYGRLCMAGDSFPVVDPVYNIPWSYQGHELALDGDGDLFWGFAADIAVRYQRRDYLGDVVITPDPMKGYNKRRIDNRFLFDIALHRAIYWGIVARASLSVLVSRSNINNADTQSSFDYDDKVFNRYLVTLELSRPF